MMRIELTFDRPLSRDTKTRLLLAAGAQAKVTRVRFVRGDYIAHIFGEALGVQTILAALAAEEVVPASATTSLDEHEAEIADDQPDARKERVRAIGR
jgi:hypothetical protein